MVGFNAHRALTGKIMAGLEMAGIPYASVEVATSCSMADVCIKGGTWDYDHLRILSIHLGTTKLSFSYDKGWGGTDVTPGDPPELNLHIIFGG